VKKSVREIGEETEQQGAHFSQYIFGTNPKGGIFYFECYWFLFVGIGHTIQIRTIKNWAQKSRHVLARFLRNLVKNFLKEVNRIGGKAEQLVVCTFSEVKFSANPYSCTDRGTIFKAVCGWDNFVM
jgi:hypothetical protein